MVIELPKDWNQLFEPELLKDIEAHAKFIRLKAEESLLESGKNVRSFPIVLNGTLKITRLDESGKEILLYYLGPNQSCAMTFSCCMQIFPSQVNIIAEEDTELITIPSTKMDEWMLNYPTWKSYTMETIRHRFDELLNTLDQVVFQKLDQRLVQYLKDKSEATGSTLLNLSHQQIAQEMASSREVISRLLKKLENEKKLLLYRGQIKLLKAF